MTEHEHRWVKEDRTLDTGFSYHYFQCKLCHEAVYPMDQLQKLFDYAEKNQFMFLENWILALFYALPDSYIVGRTSLQKQMFLIMYEFAQKENIPTENIGFRAYKYGPYSDRISEAVEEMIKSEIVLKEGRKNTAKERFELSKKGMEIAKYSFMKLTEEQREKLTDLRKEYQMWGLEGLLKYVYTYYDEYTDESKIRNTVLGLRKR